MTGRFFIVFAIPILLSNVGLHADSVGFSRDVRNCSGCHPEQAKPHPATSMAHAMETAAESGILQSHPKLSFSLGKYNYRIERRGERSVYSVTDGADTFSLPLSWAFGLGSAGQTYVFEKDGKFYESLVSYYRSIDALDVTMGDQNIRPKTVTEAAGRLLPDREAAQCFGCHTTNAIAQGRLTVAELSPGVQCERCHGPTQSHLAALKAGDVKNFAMKKLGSLSTEDTNQFCGQCHRTWEQIAMNGPHGVLNVRFQPYRLTNSKCFDIGDKRISCVACHNPHREVDTVARNYDAKCQACHAGGKTGARICKVASQDCSSCHMPKVDLPGAHHRFTDHTIRIAHENAPYPE